MFCAGGVHTPGGRLGREKRGGPEGSGESRRRSVQSYVETFLMTTTTALTRRHVPAWSPCCCVSTVTDRRPLRVFVAGYRVQGRRVPDAGQ